MAIPQSAAAPAVIGYPLLTESALKKLKLHTIALTPSPDTTQSTNDPWPYTAARAVWSSVNSTLSERLNIPAQIVTDARTKTVSIVFDGDAVAAGFHTRMLELRDTKTLVESGDIAKYMLDMPAFIFVHVIEILLTLYQQTLPSASGHSRRKAPKVDRGTDAVFVCTVEIFRAMHENQTARDYIEQRAFDLLGVERYNDPSVQFLIDLRDPASETYAAARKECIQFYAEAKKRSSGLINVHMESNLAKFTRYVFSNLHLLCLREPSRTSRVITTMDDLREPVTRAGQTTIISVGPISIPSAPPPRPRARPTAAPTAAAVDESEDLVDLTGETDPRTAKRAKYSPKSLDFLHDGPIDVDRLETRASASAAGESVDKPFHVSASNVHKYIAQLKAARQSAIDNAPPHAIGVHEPLTMLDVYNAMLFDDCHDRTSATK